MTVSPEQMGRKAGREPQTGDWQDVSHRVNRVLEGQIEPHWLSQTSPNESEDSPEQNGPTLAGKARSEIGKTWEFVTHAEAEILPTLVAELLTDPTGQTSERLLAEQSTDHS